MNVKGWGAIGGLRSKRRTGSEPISKSGRDQHGSGGARRYPSEYLFHEGRERHVHSAEQRC